MKTDSRPSKNERKLWLIIAVLALLAFAGPAFGAALDGNNEYDEARAAARGRAYATTAQPTGSGGWIQAKIETAKAALQTLASGFAGKVWGQGAAPAAAPTRLAPQAVPALPAPNRQADVSSENSAANPAARTMASESISFPGLSRSELGVMKYDLAPNVEAIPQLRIGSEDRFDSDRFALDARTRKTLQTKLFAPLGSPDLVAAEELRSLLRNPLPVAPKQSFKRVSVRHEKVDASVLQKLVLKLAPEAELKLAKFIALTPDEYRFLSGLLLYQQGYQCAAAVGLFHSLSHKPEWQAEADYFLAMCSKSLGLMTDFSERTRRIFASGDGFYSHRILREISWQMPDATGKPFGEALEKALLNPVAVKDQSPEVMATAAAMLAESAAAAEKFKTALEWAKRVPEKHPRFLQAKFVEALSEYQLGAKKRALELQEGLIKDPRTDASAREFQGLIALNLARMYFQEQMYKEAHKAFLTVGKDHPLWLQGLTEMGWAQLLSSDFEGAIGNMYSIHSPFFAAAYKPESYVIRTIGYLNLCQYGDAYRTLTVLEKEYRALLTSLDAYEKSVSSFTDGRYGTIRRFLIGFAKPGKIDLKDVDGLPSSVIREVARQKDFLNLQKALNRQVDEKKAYSKVDADIQRSLLEAQNRVTQTRKRIETHRRNIAKIRTNPALEPNRSPWMAELESELARLNDQFFSVDLFNEAKQAAAKYRDDVVAGADRRSADYKKKMEAVIANRLLKVRTDLSRYLDNNELLRYEVFAASGENIRFQVAGGEKSNRVPASAIPKSKSLQWDFDGEYWEDEIGHYRSSLKNNCPAHGEPGHREQASLDGGGR